MHFKLLGSSAVVKVLKLTDKNSGHQDSKIGSFTLSFTLSLSPTEDPKLRGSKIRLRPPGGLLSPKGFPSLWHPLAPLCQAPPPPFVVVGDPSKTKREFEILKLKLNIEITFSFNWLVHNQRWISFFILKKWPLLGTKRRDRWILNDITCLKLWILYKKCCTLSQHMTLSFPL